MYIKSIVASSLLLVFFQSCSYKTYQPVTFSTIAKESKIEPIKEGYKIELQTGDKLLNTIEPNKKGELLITGKNRMILDLIKGKDTIKLSNREVVLNKITNLRDLGGYITQDNRQIVWGKFYRSGHLHKLKRKEFKNFEELNITTVIDLRTDKEIGKKPDVLPLQVNHQVKQAYEDSEDMFTKTRKDVLKGLVTPKQADSLVSVFYSLYTFDRPKVMQDIFKELLTTNEAVLFHCSAGKDRTGMVSALLLSILKVDRKTIIEDYLLSNNYREEQIVSLMKLAKVGKVFYPKVDYQVIENFSWVKAIYIQAMFDSIDAKYGNIDNYIRDVLKISDKERQDIIEKYTNSI
ncbi:MAG: tyrosine-protein phosphatase [Flavobacteriaceae bacterium]|jgi:protein-tyrosine phosphatase|nr:tyrosine-protein phosphatase [Flavobacteriaceae bacterium]